MFDITGFFLPGALGTAITLDTTRRPTFHNSMFFTNVGTGIAANQTLPFTTPTVVNPLFVVVTPVTGFFCPNYVEVFYNRIIIEPAALSFGNVSGDISLDLAVFNAFFQSQTLTDITLNSLDSVSIATTPPSSPPTAYSPLQEITYEVLTGVDGPPIINGNILFDWATTDNITVPVTGIRVNPYPFNFTAPVTEELVWKTNTITSYDGTEQRIRIRKSARQGFEITSDINSDNFNIADNLLYDWRARFFALPIFTEKRPIDSDVTAGDTTINVSTLYGDFRIGGTGIIFVSPRDFEVFVIEEIFVGSLTLELPLANSYSASSAIVSPVRVSRLNSDPTRNFTGYNGNINCSFSSNENIELASSPSTEQFNGLDVMLDEPLKNGEFSTDTYRQEVNYLDYETGTTQLLQRWSNTKIPRNFRYVLSGLEDIWNFRLWLYRRAGRIRPFYMPSFENNLRLNDTGFLIDNFTVINDSQAKYASLRVNIAIKTFSAGFIFRTVLSYTDAGDDVIVQLTSQINIDASDIEYISYMGQKTLSSDRIEFNWLSNNVVDVTVPIIEVTP